MAHSNLIPAEFLRNRCHFQYFLRPYCVHCLSTLCSNCPIAKLPGAPATPLHIASTALSRCPQLSRLHGPLSCGPPFSLSHYKYPAAYTLHSDVYIQDVQ
jgi:hypothetical protein